jgi:SAM-dependent methyltransferase
MACNCLTLPFKNQVFDVVISIAVIHHFSTEKHRLRALKGTSLSYNNPHIYALEIVRVIKPGGKMLIYVWAMEQEVSHISDLFD